MNLSPIQVSLINAVTTRSYPDAPIRKVVYMARGTGKTTVAIELAKHFNWPIIVSTKHMAFNIKQVVENKININVLSGISRGVHKAIVDDIDMLEPELADELLLDEFICFTSKFQDNILLPDKLGNIYPDSKVTLSQCGFLIKSIPGEGITPIFKRLYPQGHLHINISKDGDKWCALIGDDLQVGVTGFGDTIREAIKELLKSIDEVYDTTELGIEDIIRKR